jgi:hypothetical protein
MTAAQLEINISYTQKLMKRAVKSGVPGEVARLGRRFWHLKRTLSHELDAIRNEQEDARFARYFGPNGR